MRSAQVVISLVLLIGGLVLLMSLSVSFLARSYMGSAYGAPPAARAAYAASSGIYDGLLRLARNAQFSSTGYTVSVGNAMATVSISAGFPSPGFVTIVSSSTVLTRQAQMTAVAETPLSMHVRVVSWNETQ